MLVLERVYNAADAAAGTAQWVTTNEPTVADSFTVALKDATVPASLNYYAAFVLLDLPGAAYKFFDLFGAPNASASNTQIGTYYNTSSSFVVSVGNGAGAEVYTSYSTSGWALGGLIECLTYWDGEEPPQTSVYWKGVLQTPPGSPTTAVPMPASWSSDTIQNYSGSSQGNQGLIARKAQSGAQLSLREMRALSAPDIAHYEPRFYVGP